MSKNEPSVNGKPYIVPDAFEVLIKTEACLCTSGNVKPFDDDEEDIQLYN